MGGRTAGAGPAPGLRRELLFGLIACVLGLGLLESASALIIALRAPGNPSVEAAVDGPDGSERLDLPRSLAQALPGTVRFNTYRNPLNRPDGRYIFRVRSNPGEASWYGFEGVNSQGFRGPKLQEHPARPGRRILILGDSCGFGWEIPHYEDTWQAQLQARLEAAGEGPFTVTNLSQPGFSSTQARALFEDLAGDLRPETVVVYLGWNDLWGSALLDDRQTLAVLRINRNPLVRLLRGSQTYRLLEDLLLAPQPAVSGGAEDIATTPPGDEPRQRVSRLETIENLEAILDHAEGLGAQVILLLPPFAATEAHKYYRMVNLNLAVADRLAGRAAMPPLLPLRHYQPDSPQYFAEDGYHPSPRGAAVIARELAGLLLGGDPVSLAPAFLELATTHPASSSCPAGQAQADPTARAWTGFSCQARTGAEPPGASLEGPSFELDPGAHRLAVRLKIDSVAPGAVARLRVQAAGAIRPALEVTLQGSDFDRPGQWQEFSWPLSTGEARRTAVRVQLTAMGAVGLTADYFQLFYPRR